MLDQPQSSKSEDFFIQEKKQYKNGSSRFIKGLLLIVISVSFLILLVLCLTLIYSLSFQIKSNTLANQILGHSLGTYAILLTRNYYSIFGFSGLWCILFFICFLLRHFWHYSQHSSYSYFKVFLGLILFLLSSAALEHLLFFTYLGQYFPFRAGGIAGSWLAMLLKKSIGTTSSIIAFLAILFISCILLSQCKLTRIFFRFKYFLFNKKLSKDEKILVKTKEIIKTPIDYFKFAKSNRLDSAIKNNHFFSPEKNIIHLQKAYENYKSLIPNAFNKLQEKFKNKKRMSSPYFQYDNIIDKQKKLIISILEKEGIKINLVQTNIGPTFTHYQLDIDRSIDHSLLKKACSSLQELTTSSHITLCQSSVNPYSCELLIAHNKASR